MNELEKKILDYWSLSMELMKGPSYKKRYTLLRKLREIRDNTQNAHLCKAASKTVDITKIGITGIVDLVLADNRVEPPSDVETT